MNKNDIGYQNLVGNYFSVNPKNVEGLNNTSYFYYRNQLYLKIFSLFTFENLPDTWDIDYLRDNLFRNGIMACVEKDGVNYCLNCGYTGINVYNKPTKVMISNTVLGTFERTIHKDCELLYINYLNGHFLSCERIVNRYALLLAQCDGSLNVNLINSRVAHVFIGETDAQIKSYKKMYDEISNGKPCAFIKNSKNGTPLDNSKLDILNVKNTYVANDILLTKRTIMNEFLTEIGINNANTNKRERLVTDEVNANDEETNALLMLWKDTMTKCFDKINAMFDTNIKVKVNENVIKRLKEEVSL